MIHIDGATSGITTVGISTSGESFRFDSNQNVTFFGSVTGTGLDVNGNADISGNLNVGGVLTYEDVTNIDSVGVITARNGIDVTGGSVGIGTDDPGAKTHIDSVTSNTPLVVEASENNRSRIVFRNNVETGTECNIELFDDDLRFVTNSGERVRIDSSGRTLIGLNSSLLSYAGLQIKGDIDNGAHICLANKTATLSSGHNIGSLRFTNNAGGIGALIGVEGDGTWSGSSYPSRIIFATTASGATSGTERLRITSGGSVDVTGKLRIDISNGGTAGSGTAEGIFLRNTQETDNNAVTIFGGADDYNTAASTAINFINVDHSANAGDISFDTRSS